MATYWLLAADGDLEIEEATDEEGIGVPTGWVRTANEPLWEWNVITGVTRTSGMPASPNNQLAA